VKKAKIGEGHTNTLVGLVTVPVDFDLLNTLMLDWLWFLWTL